MNRFVSVLSSVLMLLANVLAAFNLAVILTLFSRKRTEKLAQESGVDLDRALAARRAAICRSIGHSAILTGIAVVIWRGDRAEASAAARVLAAAASISVAGHLTYIKGQGAFVSIGTVVFPKPDAPVQSAGSPT